MKTFAINFDPRSAMRAFVSNAKKFGWRGVDKGTASGDNGSRWVAQKDVIR